MDSDAHLDDPHSADYRRAQLDRYRKLSADAKDPEPAPASMEDDPVAVKRALDFLAPIPGSTILEFGSGRGGTAIALAKAGFKTITVDADAGRCEVLRRKASAQGVALEVVNADYDCLSRLPEPVDAVLFFSSFHSAPDHQGLLRSLDAAIHPGGKALFASEPINLEFPVPWGLRVDDAALGRMRLGGRLELGFQEKYFSEAVGRVGWTLHKHASGCFEVKRRKVWSLKFPGSAREIRSQSGTKRKSKLCVKSSKPGFFLFGPFVSLPAGSWDAVLTLRASSGGNCLMDVCSGPSVFASRQLQLSAVGEEPVVLPFELSAHSGNVEVRLHSSDPVDVEILQLDISPAFTPRS